MKHAVKIACPKCGGAKCPECANKGTVRAGKCERCIHGADLMAGPTPLCEGHAAICVLCDLWVDRHTDALPFGGAGLAHTACVLVAAQEFAGRFLEAADGSVESDQAVDVNRHVSKSTGQPTGTHMPKSSQRTKDLMRELGYITIIEAANMTGHAPGTLYRRIQRKTLNGRKSGPFHFVELASLYEAYPHLKAQPAAPAAAPGARSTEAA